MITGALIGTSLANLPLGRWPEAEKYGTDAYPLALHEEGRK